MSENCPNPDCGNQGYYAEGSHEDGWTQVPCEFCWMNENSVFNHTRVKEEWEKNTVPFDQNFKGELPF